MLSLERSGAQRVIATVVAVSVIIALSFGLWAIWGIRAARKTLVAEAQRDALALLESLTLAAQYSVATGALVDRLEFEKQLAHADLIAAGLARARLDSAALAGALARFDADGLSMRATSGDLLTEPSELNRLLGSDPTLARLLPADRDPLDDVVSVSDSVGGVQWTGLLRSLPQGELIVWNRGELETTPAVIGGIGQLIQQIGAASNVHYIMLQAPDGIVFASRPLKPVLKLAADSFLVSVLSANISATREIEFEDVPTLEAAKPFLSEDLPSGMFRVGVSLAAVHAAQSRLAWQLGVAAVLFVLLATTVIAFLLGRQSLINLGQVYRRVETINKRILDAIDQGVIAVDGSKRISVFNPAAEAITGRTGADAIESDCDTVLASEGFSLKEVGSSGESVRDREISLRADGQERILVYTTSPVLRADGHPEGAVAVIRDETTARELAQRVRQSERLSEMGHLAAGVAHEIRNPLNAIALAAQRLRLAVGDADAKNLAATVWEESKRLNTIIDDYLSLARSSAEAKRPIRLERLVGTIAEMARLDAEKRGITLVLSLPPESVVNAAEGELRKAIWNVLSNALSATMPDGRIRLSLQHAGDTVLLQLDDSGSGIDPIDLPRVFQPYYTTKTGGTGLGLAITHRIISDHGGTIALESPVPGQDRGTRVIIRLPRVQET
ncbi:MAG TPA: ATP-binding protein [candidate division Zixibacteria bacterium]|jgi:PAS domain S-box-containing protein